MDAKQIEGQNDIVQYTAEKLKSQSDDLLQEFNELVVTEAADLEQMSEKSHRLMDIFEQDTHQFSE